MKMCEKCPYSFSHDEDFSKPCPGCIGKKCFEYPSCRGNVRGSLSLANKLPWKKKQNKL